MRLDGIARLTTLSETRRISKAAGATGIPEHQRATSLKVGPREQHDHSSRCAVAALPYSL